MNKTTGAKVISGIMGTAALLNACAPAAAPDVPVVGNVARLNSAAEAGEEAKFDLEAPYEEREKEVFSSVAHVQGEFSFDQNVLTPPDEVFNLFGTAATYICAKPGFAFDEVLREEHYVNVSGDIKKSYSISMAELEKRKVTERSMVCSCATGMAVAQTRVKGIDVSDIIAMADLEEGVNTITFKGDEGYGLPLPLSYVQDKGAMLVYQIGGKDLPASQGAPLQVWMPETVAQYFTRRVTEIELTREETVPEVKGVDEQFRAKVGIVNRFKEEFQVGDQIRFEGYADDCGVAIASIEFSLDGGATWTSCETKNATSDRWVYWYFGYTAQMAGTFKLDVRARTMDGTVSPLYSSVVFTVIDKTADDVLL